MTRAAGAFTDVERRALEQVLPHLQRALQLRGRLALEAQVNRVGTAALDALSVCVVIVDCAMRMLYANEAGAQFISPGRSGLTVGRAVAGEVQLSARHRGDNDALRRLVAQGGVRRRRWCDAGCARGPKTSPRQRRSPSLVSPVPARLVTAEAGWPEDWR